MKTKLLLTFVLLSFFGHTYSQDYFPFLNKSSWVINDAVSCCSPPQIRQINEGTDEFINGYTYTKFIDPFPVYDTNTNSYIDSIYVREDVEGQKVYKIVDGEDALLYDFSMQDGDIVFQYGYHWEAEVDDCDMVGGNRKRITLHSVELWNNNSLTQVWIEGVGTNAHPFYPERNMYNVMASGGGYNIYTKCSFQDGQQVFGSSSECESFALATAENELTDKEISLFPNPFVTELTINSGILLRNATLRLYDLQGRMVKEVTGMSGTSITILRENLNRGLYLVQLSQNGKTIKSAKVMVD